ncbi:hypothetical protein C497_02177 [Halalkalicoccus jeotgali B3]|uniref:Uncharacterized protein n=1 Tax=Halalkalicoccus jeotgali (strain DSM 18796 / CECT 7217 / JCM 14584 / KCTC 4019 / B3) TaxID=795797 RepID=D8JBR6_HALJB|nr:hypothetical protein HacjB3_16846 [Halalkalicoccus jeotgali B3]ELY40852.1 hypothetical protein C497_02177 [Halalkalicoccus jeotgali B3]
MVQGKNTSRFLEQRHLTVSHPFHLAADYRFPRAEAPTVALREMILLFLFAFTRHIVTDSEFRIYCSKDVPIVSRRRNMTCRLLRGIPELDGQFPSGVG